MNYQGSVEGPGAVEEGGEALCRVAAMGRAWAEQLPSTACLAVDSFNLPDLPWTACFNTP